MGKTDIIDTTAENILELGVCGYKNLKREGYPERIAWIKQRFSDGLKIKTLYSAKDGNQGMIEYLPGDFAWRPVKASGYMFVHCIFLGFKHEYKGKGFGSLLLRECERDSKELNFKGVAAVVRNGSFMVGKEFFIKNGYRIVDQAPPDFELLIKKFDERFDSPEFNHGWESRIGRYGDGLSIIRADQCPYTVKNVREIIGAAYDAFGITPSVINLKNFHDAQNSPCPFGVFCILFKGKVIANHPISKTRFLNIMNGILGKEKGR
jgi:GNAT superfamily N-acetyltransferase